MQTGENEQALRKIIDMTRLISIVILAIHFYYCCYHAFEIWDLTSNFSGRLVNNIYKTGLFDSFNKSKVIAAGFLLISLMGAKGRKEEKINYKTGFAYIISGLIFYFFSYFLVLVKIKISQLQYCISE